MMYPAMRSFKTERGRNGEFTEDFKKSHLALAHVGDVPKTNKCETAVNIKGMSIKEMLDKKYPYRGMKK